MPELDRTERKILDILQRNGRIAMTELAPAPLGAGQAHGARGRDHGIPRTSSTQGAGQEPVGVRLHVPDVQECHIVSGTFDDLVKARLGGMDEYRSRLGDILKKLPVTAQSNSYVVMEELKVSLLMRTARQMRAASRLRCGSR